MSVAIHAGEAAALSGETEQRYAAFFHDLDAWTEYWDVYHPQTRGRFYFGNGADEAGLLTLLLPRERRPEVFVTWTRMARGWADRDSFAAALAEPAVTHAVQEVDLLLDALFRARFGDPGDADVQADYLEAIFRFATNALPPATERDRRISESDPRKPTAGRHRLEGDLMWFAWALVLEAAALLVGHDEHHTRRALMLAGIATGCPADFAWRGHRRTRSSYAPNKETAKLLGQLGLGWANNMPACAEEIHALYRIREWGEPG